MGRTTNDPKKQGIRVRFNQDTIDWLYKTSREENKTISQIIRDIIADKMAIKNK